MRPKDHSLRLARLTAEIDFSNERYYNLYFESATEAPPSDLEEDAWANLTSLTADLAKIRGELYRLGRGVELLKLPAIEAVGLDQVADQLRSLESRLRPLSEVLSRGNEDDSRLKRFLKDLLVVIDALDRVFELVDQQPGAISEGVERGLRSVYQLLLETAGRYGLKAMIIGQDFDPHLQMAMGTEPNPGLPDGKISRVLLMGYLYNNEVLRTAQVVVVKNDVETK